ncbi:MAG: MlaD family protein [Candidatus Methylomirabilales bacterium]
MEPRSGVKVVVGLFVFAGLLLFAASIFFLGERGRYFAPQHPLQAFFTNAAGLHKGATVSLGGVAVGRVTGIRLSRPPEQKVRVELNVAGAAIESVRRDSVARIETLGFLGDKFVEISVGTPQEPRLPDGGTLQVKEPADFGTLVGQGQRVLGHAERFSASLDTMLATLKDAQTAEAIASVAQSLKKFAASLERGEGAVHWLTQDPASRRFVQDLGRTAEALADLSTEMKKGRGLAHALIYDPEGGKVVQEFSQTLQEVHSMLQTIRQGEGAIPALLFDPKSRQLVENLTETSHHLKEITAKIARGDGTLGAFLVDPTVYENLTALLEGARRSWILRGVIRSAVESGREAKEEKAQARANKQ